MKYKNIENQNNSILLERKKEKITTCGPSCQFNNSVIFILTKANHNPIKQDHMKNHQAFLLHQQHKEYCMLTHSALAGVVWNDELKKMALYKDFVNHCNNIIYNRGTKGGENEFGRLFQGFLLNSINGLDYQYCRQKGKSCIIP